MKNKTTKLPELALYPNVHNWFEGKRLVVKQNIGYWSKKVFGEVGEEVRYDWDGKIYDKRMKGFEWTVWKCRKNKHDIDKLNSFFSIQDKFQTIFEVVECE